MPHWKLTLAYDGTPYNGWQIQPNLPTVQGTLAHAIHHITGETTLPQGSGRTDTGVHALAQVATVSLATPIPGPNLHRALNRILPPSIRVLAVDEVPEDFHARHSARRKTYEYRILPGNRICSPMRAPYVWAFQRPLNLAILQRAAAYVIGTHDFTSFAATDPDLITRTDSEEDEEVEETHAGASQRNPGVVISTGGGALAASVEKPASLPLPSASPLSDHPKNGVISTEAEDSFIVRSAVERPASLPQLSASPLSDRPKNSVISTEAEDSFIVRSEVERPAYLPLLSASPLSDRPKNSVISTEAEDSFIVRSAVERPASLPLLSLSPNVRTIHHSTWHQQEDLYIYRVTGSGFLHHMVRNLVGTFVQTATGHIAVEDIPKILAARNRSAAGFTAPPRGLFLVEVEYE